MKKQLFITFLFIFLCNFLYSQQIENQNWSLNVSPVSINLLNFDEKALSSAEEMSIVSAMLSTSLGFGYHLNIIPNIFSPGLYLDMGIGYLSLLLSSNDDYENNTFGGWAGFRLYNRFRFNLIDIEPFIGLTIYGFSNLGVPATTFGMLLAYNYFGIEYSFHNPIFNAEKIYYVHRISFLLHFR